MVSQNASAPENKVVNSKLSQVSTLKGPDGFGRGKKMITHKTADEIPGTDRPNPEEEGDLPAKLTRTDTPDAVSIEDEDEKTSCWNSARNLVAFAVLVWLGQVVIAVSLKKMGWIEKDLNEIVAERVIPELQYHLENSINAWSPFNESLWLRLNETMSVGQRMQERQRPGFQLAKEGAKGNYPVIMIPGFVTSGLEVWQGKECARNYFRQRMWGGVGSARQFLMDRDCVLQHLALDPVTGGDKEGIRLRSAQGFEAADYFMANYWVWGKILENLADVGYDGSMMSMESYDWRLAFPILEKRDGFLTKLKYRIESFHKSAGKKVIISSHSLGAILVHFFFAWVTASEKEGGGGGGKDWVDKHIHAYINVAGAHLGVPKAASALLSGEMRDTIFMGTVGTLVEQFIGRKLRRDLWSSWGSLWSMLPKGGDAIWGVGADFNEKDANDDSSLNYFHFSNHTLREHSVPAIVMTSNATKARSEDLDDLTCAKEHLIDPESELQVNEALKAFASRKSQSTRETIDFLLKWGAGMGPSLASSKLHEFNPDAKASIRTWHDVTRTPLPYAPNMKIYCLYGVGLKTERAYYYKRNTGEGQLGVDNKSVSATRTYDPPFVLDTSVEDPEHDIIHGVKYVDGDASVPLTSLGYICSDAWQRKDSGLNPSGTKVITREYMDRHEFSVDDPMRGGPYSADHVDILGNLDMMEDFVKIVTGHNVESVQTRLVSDIEKIATRINEKGGIYRRRRWRFRP